MALVRVYHPETNEPFDLPEAKATKLRLEKGWLSQPFERVPTPEPVELRIGLPADVLAEIERNVADWRSQPATVVEPEDEDEVAEPEPAPRGRGRSRRRAEGDDEQSQ